MYGGLERSQKQPTMVNSQSSKKFRSIVALHAIEMLDDEGKCVLSAGFFQNKNAHTREFILDDDERVIGISSRIEKRYATQAIHRDFQFIIGRRSWFLYNHKMIILATRS